MSDITIKIPENQIADHVSAAIMRALDDNTKNQMIESALKHLMSPPSNSYGPRTSPLQDAFNNAVSIYANKLIRERLETDTKMQNQIKALFQEAWDEAMKGHREKIVERMASSFGDFISGNR